MTLASVAVTGRVVTVWNPTVAIAGFTLLAVTGIIVRPLLPVDETRYLAVAWEMWRSGNLLVPTLNGEIYTHKPPLLFWLINTVWAVVGVSETAARLIAPAFGCFAILLTARLERVLWPLHEPSAALVLATTGVFLVFASLTMFDAMLTVAVLLGVLSLWRASRDQSASPWIAFGLALALGTLAKGPVILVHLLPVALLMPLWAPDVKRMRWYISLVCAIPLAIALVAMWLVPALIAGGEAYQEAVLWKQSAGRIVKSFAHRQPVWFFVAVLPALLWPWGWSLAFWRSLAGAKPLSDPATRLCLVWAGSTFLIFSLVSGKQIHYLIPELPAFALLFSRFSPNTLGRMDALLAFLPLGFALATLCIVAGIDLPIRKMQALNLDLSWTGLCIALVLTIGTALLLRGRGTLALATLAPAMLASLYLVAAPEIARTYGTNAIASALKSHEAYCMAQVGGRYHGEFTFAGRLTRPVDVLEGDIAVALWTKAHPGGVLFGRAERMPAGTEGGQIHLFRGRPYRLWTVPVQ